LLHFSTLNYQTNNNKNKDLTINKQKAIWLAYIFYDNNWGLLIIIGLMDVNKYYKIKNRWFFFLF